MDKKRKKSALETKLLSYARHNLNILLEGRHGVGKSAIIENIFNEMGWNYLILNASTIDPYLDFSGIPNIKKVKLDDLESDNEIDVLNMAMPLDFALDRIDAIFFDEINRGNKEILNGLFDLIQFKKIKNKKLNRLKLVWAAQNPYDEDVDEDEQIYNVKPLDPALKDRFHIYIKMPYKLDKEYLLWKYDNLAKPFIEWWESLDIELKYKCSPRRLDYGIHIYRLNGELNDVFDAKLPISSLKNKLKEFNKDNEYLELSQKINSLSVKDAIKLIKLENYNKVIDLIKNNMIDIKYIASINQDYIVKYLINNKDTEFISKINEFVSKNKDYPVGKELKDIIEERINIFDNILNKYLSKFVNNDTLTSSFFISLGESLNNTLFEFYLETKEILKVDDLYSFFEKNKYFNFIKDKYYSYYNEIFTNEVKIVKFMKEKKIESIKEAQKLKNDNIDYFKNILNNKNNIYINSLINGYFFKRIIINALAEYRNIKHVESDKYAHLIINNYSKDINKYNSAFGIAFEKNELEFINMYMDIIEDIILKSNDISQFEINLKLFNSGV